MISFCSIDQKINPELCTTRNKATTVGRAHQHRTRLNAKRATSCRGFRVILMPRIPIDQLDDPRLADYQNVRDADLRGGKQNTKTHSTTEQLFIVESEMIVQRLIQSNWPIKSLLLTPRRATELDDALATLSADIPIYIATDRTLIERITGYEHHHGCLAIGRRSQPSSNLVNTFISCFAPDSPLTLIAIAGITNVDNIGAIFRNAAAIGADGIVIGSGCADPLFRKAIRVSMGHVFHLPWIAVDQSLADIFMQIKSIDPTIQSIAAETSSPNHTTTDITQFNWPRRSIIAFGSERFGHDEQTLHLVDTLIGIPMHNNVDSLNVAVAMAIVLHCRNHHSR